MTKSQKQIHNRMLSLGFVEEETGGNCTAYRAELYDDCHILITNDAEMPKRRNEYVTVGFYNTNGDNIAVFECNFSLILDKKIKFTDLADFDYTDLIKN